MTLEIHPIADRLPNMPEDQFKKFKEDIGGLGVLEPIILLEGKILDGRHRYKACQELGIECPTKTVENLSPNDLVRSMNLYRRHLDEGQRSMVAASLLKPFEDEAKERQRSTLKKGDAPVVANLPEREKERSRDAIGKALNVSGRTVSDAKVVTTEGTPEEIKAVTEGKAAVSTTAKKARDRRPPVKPKKKALGTMNECNENIGWSAYSWNPLTGCKHGCPYCYAAAMSKRYDWSFKPQLHENRLDYPANTKKKDNLNNRVFTCSMGELFGPWVPDEWIEKVFESVRANPQWTFLFLTKNPERLPGLDWPGNAWIGATIDTQDRVAGITDAFNELYDNGCENTMFVSCEPLLGPVELSFDLVESLDWLIIGAKSEGQKKVQPQNTWVEYLLGQAREAHVPVWFKDNLIFRPQETP